MDFAVLEEFLFLNKAALFDAATFCGIASVLVWLLSVRYFTHFFRVAAGWMFVLSITSSAALCLLEFQHQAVAIAKHRVSPYYLAGYNSLR